MTLWSSVLFCRPLLPILLVLKIRIGSCAEVKYAWQPFRTSYFSNDLKFGPSVSRQPKAQLVSFHVWRGGLCDALCDLSSYFVRNEHFASKVTIYNE